MKKLNYRHLILAALFLVAVCGILSTPAEDLSLIEWLNSLLVSKSIGFGAIALMAILYRRWSASGKLN